MGRLTDGALGGYGGKWGMAWAKTTWIFVENPCEGCWPLSCGIGSWGRKLPRRVDRVKVDFPGPRRCPCESHGSRRARSSRS